MPDDQDTTAATDTAADELERLRRHNATLLAEAKAAKAQLKDLPDPDTVAELKRFKEDRERLDLEQAGNYDEARKKLQQQYDADTTALKERISTLEAELQNLRVLTPATARLADVVHDPQLVLTAKLGSRTIETDSDGNAVVVDGLTRTPIEDWAKASLPSWMLKAPKPQGSGAPAGGRAPTASISGGDPDLVHFIKASQNLTQQARIYKADPERYRALKAAARGK